MLKTSNLDDLHSALLERGPVSIGIVGFGHMGSTLVAQLRRLPGLRPAAIYSSRPSEVIRDLAAMDTANGVGAFETNSLSEAQERISQGQVVVTRDIQLLPRIPSLSVIVDATGNPEIGAWIGWTSLHCGKHVATFNVEADSIVGSILAAKALHSGLVYTGLAGDEPAAIMELVNFAKFLELPIMAVGKGKNNPLQPSCTPDMFDPMCRAPSARSSCSFVDGTNTMVEMAAVANAAGFSPDVRGMHGPKCTVDDLAHLFVPKADGGLLEHEQVVDYTMGSIAPGVFAVIAAEAPVVKSIYSYVYKRGGKYLALVRPYHLLSLEAPISIAQAVVHKRATIASSPHKRTAEVVAFAKRKLFPGERIDGIGGYTVRGVIERYDRAAAQNLMPIGILEGATLLREVEEGQPISKDDVDLLKRTAAAELWQRQRAWLGGKVDDKNDLLMRALSSFGGSLVV